MLPRGRVYRYPPGRGLPDVSMPIARGMLSVPYDMGGMPMRDALISHPRKLPCNQPIEPHQLWSQLVLVDSLHI